MTTNVGADLANWIDTTAHAEHRTRANLLWILLEEARTARTTTQAAQNGHPAHIAGQTTIPVPGIRP